MQAKWIDTHSIYRAIIDAPDMATREQLYCERFVEPWQQMMAMLVGNGSATDDPFVGARALHWLLPQHLTDAPEAFTKLETANAWGVGAAAMTTAVERFTPYADQIALDEIEGWLMLADPTLADPIMRGYTGAVDWTQPRFVVQFSEPTDDNLPRLGGCIVHEMHHLIRATVMPWNIMTATLAEYAIFEGLAESFAATLYGEDLVGHYVTDFDEGQIDTAKALVGENLEATGFNTLRAFIFGDHWAQKLGIEAVGMPAYGGYAIGYRLVQAYLRRTGTTIEAATFIPAAEIVAQSGYFD